MEPVRFYLGGVPEGVTSEELSKRFTPFGIVKCCEFAPTKEYPTSLRNRTPVTFERRFAFVTVVPKDPASVNRALSVYQGAKWKGSVLRCQLARPTMKQRLAEEAQAELAAAEKGPRTMPIAKDGIILHIKKPYFPKLVAIRLGGGEVKYAPLSKPDQIIVGRSQEERQQNGTTQREKAISNEKAGLKTSVQDATTRRQNTTNKRLKTIDVAAPVSKEPLRRSERHGAGGPKVRPPLRIPQFKDSQPRILPYMQASDDDEEHPQERASVGVTVDFLSTEEQSYSITNTVGGEDLSRFDDDDSGDAGPLEHKARGRIPQIDGAADVNTDSESEDTPSISSGTNTSGDSDSLGTRSGDDDTETGTGTRAPKAQSSSPTIDTSSDDDSESDTPSGNDDIAIDILNASRVHENTADRDSGDGGPTDEGPPADATSRDGDDVSWLQHVLPAGASFYRKDPLVQIEAAWRANREGAVREWKELRRQALRQTGKRKSRK